MFSVYIGGDYMARHYGPAQDGLLAMISVLSVMFLVLFVSCAYFLSLGATLAARDAATMAELQQMQQVQPAQGDVAGYETEYDPQYVDLENSY